MSLIKYRIHEVAKDFNTTSKVISQILTDYATTPKNHMQVLENFELDLIFEHITQNNQVASLAEVFNTAPKAEPKPADKQEKPDKKGEGKQSPAPAAAPATAPKKENKHHLPKPVADKRVIDNRKL